MSLGLLILIVLGTTGFIGANIKLYKDIRNNAATPISTIVFSFYIAITIAFIIYLVYLLGAWLFTIKLW